MIEKDIDKYLVKTLQRLRIDFLHIRNSGFSKHKSAAFHTTAYEEKFPCDKYMPDFMIFHNGYLILVENGIRNGRKFTHSDRKLKQMERMLHIKKHTNAFYFMLSSIKDVDDMCNTMFKTIGKAHD